MKSTECYCVLGVESTAEIHVMLFCGKLRHTTLSSFSITNIAPSN